MRKHRQRQILDLLKTINEAQSSGLYADCQDGAIVLGEFIESIEGEGTRTVALLEEYCELLFKASNGEAGRNSLNKHIVKIENSVRQELKPNKVEMAFLSYKASMSDSTESIYRAAKADPSCDAFWIPIPYCDRKADGTFGEMLYEGADCYSDDIECTDWRDYDIEARRPDVIFTFNPYDAGNYVTSVHPDFYSKRLSNFTDLLVYVPYFVAQDDVDEHFCAVAGCVYAHKVIVQSEKVRETYIRVFKENYGNKLGRPEDKFIALGSPKLDKVIRGKHEEHELPENWQKIIQGKKAILYNTTVGGILKTNEHYLRKIHYTLESFDSRSDAVLWWRPHPLSESTCASMRPGLLEEYKIIVAEYIREGWGIYDDTPDMHRALARTDAYYGDKSSLVPLYAATGKPIMIQNAYFQSDNKAHRALQFENMYDDGNYLWVTAFSFNALFRIDKQSWRAEYMGSFPGEKVAGKRLYRAIIEYDGKLYFAPGSAENIGVYDVATGCFNVIRFENDGEIRGLDNKFAFTCIYGSKLFFAGHSYPAIISYDLSNGTVQRYDDWVDLIERKKPASDYFYFYQGKAVKNKLFLPSCLADAVMEFDMNDGTSIIHRIGSGCSGYADINVIGGHIWLTPLYGGAVVCWCENENKVSKYEIPGFKCGFPDADTTTTLPSYGGSIQVCEDIFLFPFYANKAVKINTTNGEFSMADMFQRECEHEYVLGTGYCRFSYIDSIVSGNKIYAKTGRSNTLIEYDTETGSRREEHIEIPPDAIDLIKESLLTAIEEYGERKQLAECLFYDSFNFDLEDFIRYNTDGLGSPAAISMRQQQLEAAAKVCGRLDGVAGETIYRYCITEAKRGFARVRV